MVAVALKERAAQDQGWQPDRRTTAVLAFLAAILLCLGFLGLLYRPAQPTLDRHATPLFLQTLPALKTIRHQFKHTVRPRTLTPMTVQSLRIPAPTVLETLQDLLYIGTKELPEEQRANGVFLQQPQGYDDLSRALHASDKPGALQQGASYRSEYGDTIVKSGDGCVAMREVQVGPWGTKAPVSFALPCPGSYRSTMEDKLADWAKKVKAAQLPPP